MADGFHIIPASANPTGGKAALAMQRTVNTPDDMSLTGVQLCPECYFDDCAIPVPRDLCGAGACGDSPSRPVTVTMIIALTSGGCTGPTCTVGPSHPGAPPCGNWVCAPSDRCSPCGCDDGVFVLPRFSGFPGDMDTNCQYRYAKTAAMGYVNCCAGSGTHSLTLTFNLHKVDDPDGWTASAGILYGDGSGTLSTHYTKSAIPDCGDFTINLIPDVDSCGGTVTIIG